MSHSSKNENHKNFFHSPWNIFAWFSNFTTILFSFITDSRYEVNHFLSSKLPFGRWSRRDPLAATFLRLHFNVISTSRCYSKIDKTTPSLLSYISISPLNIIFRHNYDISCQPVPLLRAQSSNLVIYMLIFHSFMYPT